MPLGCPATVEFGLVADIYPRNDREDSGISEPRFIVLIDEGFAIEQRHGGGVIAIHLRTDDLAGFIRPANIEMALLAHADRETIEIVRRQPALPKLQHSVDR